MFCETGREILNKFLCPHTKTNYTIIYKDTAVEVVEITCSRCSYVKKIEVNRT
jgi:hypothetical protein